MFWKNNEEITRSKKHIDWIKRLYHYMTPYVSKNPRGAYMNYRDLDIRKNSKGSTTSYTQASIWGIKYFKNNFNRLVHVKTIVDFSNFFRNAQSIPPLSLFMVEETTINPLYKSLSFFLYKSFRRIMFDFMQKIVHSGMI